MLNSIWSFLKWVASRKPNPDQLPEPQNASLLSSCSWTLPSSFPPLPPFTIPLCECMGYIVMQGGAGRRSGGVKPHRESNTKQLLMSSLPWFFNFTAPGASDPLTQNVSDSQWIATFHILTLSSPFNLFSNTCPPHPPITTSNKFSSTIHLPPASCRGSSFSISFASCPLTTNSRLPPPKHSL